MANLAKYIQKAATVDAYCIGDETWPLEIWQGVLSADIIRHEEEDPPFVEVYTLSGMMAGLKGDWIVKGPEGDFSIVKGNIFPSLYDKKS